MIIDTALSPKVFVLVTEVIKYNFSFEINIPQFISATTFVFFCQYYELNQMESMSLSEQTTNSDNATQLMDSNVTVVDSSNAQPSVAVEPSRLLSL